MLSSSEARGLARSLVVYYGQPWRTIALRRFYRSWITPGSLVFDVGAHVGHRSMAMAAAGAHVVAIEPQPLFADFLARLMRRRRDMTLVRSALGAATGHAELNISRRHPTVSTLSSEWIDRVGATRGFDHVAWDRRVAVELRTLDDLIADYGEPVFCKIDVEGLEAEILAGLGRPLERIAFECLPAARSVAEACVDRLVALGPYQFNAVIGEKHRWAYREWMDAAACRRMIRRLADIDRGADIYARRCMA